MAGDTSKLNRIPIQNWQIINVNFNSYYSSLGPGRWIGEGGSRESSQAESDDKLTELAELRRLWRESETRDPTQQMEILKVRVRVF